ncbi:hypothetical protein B0A50_07932 [Salinomyces thailandicus]|uniref:Uncharacterized protein n=1 Tax=Salinomyces thailandicus TaxID=706561 RepID=A0A4U0TL35_9PEZI|nr:hypothetical protein B0A50_07932 [Salinomyces thailandica]
MSQHSSAPDHSTKNRKYRFHVLTPARFRAPISSFLESGKHSAFYASTKPSAACITDLSSTRYDEDDKDDMDGDHEDDDEDGDEDDNEEDDEFIPAPSPVTTASTLPSNSEETSSGTPTSGETSLPNRETCVSANVFTGTGIGTATGNNLSTNTSKSFARALLDVKHSEELHSLVQSQSDETEKVAQSVLQFAKGKIGEMKGINGGQGEGSGSPATETAARTGLDAGAAEVGWQESRMRDVLVLGLCMAFGYGVGVFLALLCRVGREVLEL